VEGRCICRDFSTVDCPRWYTEGMGAGATGRRGGRKSTPKLDHPRCGCEQHVLEKHGVSNNVIPSTTRGSYFVFYACRPLQRCHPRWTRCPFRCEYVLFHALESKNNFMPWRKSGCIFLYFMEFLRDLNKSNGTIRSRIREIPL